MNKLPEDRFKYMSTAVLIYSLYIKYGVERAVEHLCSLSCENSGPFELEHETKAFILRDINCPLTTEDKVYLATYQL